MSWSGVYNCYANSACTEKLTRCDYQVQPPRALEAKHEEWSCQTNVIMNDESLVYSLTVGSQHNVA